MVHGGHWPRRPPRRLCHDPSPPTHTILPLQVAMVHAISSILEETQTQFRSRPRALSAAEMALPSFHSALRFS